LRYRAKVIYVTGRTERREKGREGRGRDNKAGPSNSFLRILGLTCAGNQKVKKTWEK
jgi:hypothetical protein